MDITSRPNARVAVSIPSEADRVVEFHLDGWPLPLIDLDQGWCASTTWEPTHAFSHGAVLPKPINEPAVDTGSGVDGNSILVAVGTILGVVSPLQNRPSHAEVQVIQMDAERASPKQMLLDC